MYRVILKYVFLCTGIYCVMVEGACDEPAPVTNAYRYFEDNGNIVRYVCYSGFLLVNGSLERECQTDGSYSNTAPVCILHCGEPRSMSGATKIHTPGAVRWKSKVYYRCLPNYNLTDSGELFAGECSHNVGSWEKQAYRCTDPNKIQISGPSYLSTEVNVIGVTAENPIDGSEKTCTNTEPELKPTWETRIDNDNFYDIHIVKIRIANMMVVPKSITIEAISYFGQPSGHLCYKAEILEIYNWMQFVCDEYSIGRVFRLTAEFDSPTSFQLCEVEFYGRLQNYDCEQPFFYYGAFYNYTLSGFQDKADYSCEQGFTRIGGSSFALCWTDSHWIDIGFTCYDGFKANVYSSKVILVDGDTSTCKIFHTLVTLQVHDLVEVHSVTVVGPTAWQDICVLITDGDTSTSRECSSDGSDWVYSDVRTFYCPYQLLAENITVTVEDAQYLNKMCEVHVWGRPVFKTDEVFECLQTRLGTDYKGTTNTTISGHECKPWKHILSSFWALHQFPDTKIPADFNYCRNPAGYRKAPWCYTSADYNEWEYCSIISCEIMCKIEVDGNDYKGIKNTTSGGHGCISWMTELEGIEPFPYRMIGEDVNYCRNPGRSQSTPWCYTSTASTDNYQHCSIPDCPYLNDVNKLDITMSVIQLGYWLFRDCWRVTIETEPKQHTLFNVDLNQDYTGLCINVTFLQLWCYSLNDDKHWYILHINCTDLKSDEWTTESTMLVTETTTPATTESKSVSPESASTQSVSTTSETTSESSIASQSTPTEIEPTTEESKNESCTVKTTIKTVTTHIASAKNSSCKLTTLSGIEDNHTGCISIVFTHTSFPNDTCELQCKHVQVLAFSHSDLDEYKAKIKRILLINRQLLVSVKQKYECRIDERPSVVYVGCSAVGLFMFPIIIIICLDVLTFFKSIKHTLCKS